MKRGLAARTIGMHPAGRMHPPAASNPLKCSDDSARGHAQSHYWALPRVSTLSAARRRWDVLSS